MFSTDVQSSCSARSARRPRTKSTTRPSLWNGRQKSVWVAAAAGASGTAVQGHGLAGLREEAAIAHLEVALGGQVLGHQQVVALEFDVPVGHALDAFLTDRRAVDQRRRRDQHLAKDVHGDRVAGRHHEVARRTVLGEGMRRDAHRQHLVGAGMTGALDRALPDPDDRPGRTRRGNGKVTDAQLLDGHVAPSGADQRPADETRYRIDVARRAIDQSRIRSERHALA